MAGLSNDRAVVVTRPDGTLAVAGELDAFSADVVDAALAAMPAGSTAIVDASGATFIDSSVLRVFVRQRDRLTASGGGLRFAAVSEPVRRLLEVSRLDRYLEVGPGLAT